MCKINQIIKMLRCAFSSILILWVVGPFVQFLAEAISLPEAQTKPSLNLTGSSNIETNIFLPTLSSDTMSFTKLSDFTQNKRFKPRLPKKIVPNQASTTEPTITKSNIKEIVAEEDQDDKLEDSSSPSPTSLSAKRNFFRRRRKPDIKTTLGVSEEFDDVSKEALISDKSKNETAVDLIMQKIKRAQKFKSGRKSFHTSSGFNKNRKRLIKNRARFRPPLTTDKTIPNTSTAPILATNDKLMRIAANRRKKQEEEKLIQNQTEKSSKKNIKIKNFSSKRRKFSKKDWSKKTKETSLVGEKLKAMREKRKNKYKNLKTQKSRAQLSSVDDNESYEENSDETEITTKVNDLTDSESPTTTQKLRKSIYNQYPRVVIQRPMKKPDEKVIEIYTEKDIETTSPKEIVTTPFVRETTTGTEKETETILPIEEEQETDVDTTTQRIKIKPRKVGYKMNLSDIKQKIHRKTTFTKTKKPKYNFRPKETTSKKLLKETIETSKLITNLDKEQSTTTISSILIQRTTKQPSDLKYSATTKKFEENTSKSKDQKTNNNDNPSENEIMDEPEPEVEPELTEPKPEPPTQPKLDWSAKRKHRNSLFDRRNRKNILKGSFIRLDDSQFSGSENEEVIAEDYPDLANYEYEESADPEDSGHFKTLYDIDTFGTNQFSQEYENIESITPKIKRKIPDDQVKTEQFFKDRIKHLRNEVISSIIEKYPEEVIVSKTDNSDEFSTARASASIESSSLDNDFSGSDVIQTLSDLNTGKDKQQITSLGIESLASLVNLPSSFDSINDEDNFIFTDRYPSKNIDKTINSKTVLKDSIARRQDTKKTELVDIVESENQENGDRVTEALDDRIINEIETILEISIPEESKIRRKNSLNRIIRRQNPSSLKYLLAAKDFVDVLPNGTSLVSILGSFLMYQNLIP